MLTGLLPPTSGDCLINGRSIVHETDLARQSLGICFQQNVLFERLTVREHLSFFQRIKGKSPNAKEVEALAEQIKNSKDQVVEALYPIMGKMIKKYISQEISLLTERINKQLEDSFSTKSWKRKFKSWFGGVREEELLLSIRSVAKGKKYFSPEIAEKMINFMSENQISSDILTNKEFQVLKLIAKGMTTKEIALQLYVSSRTIETHRANILKKLEVKNTAALIKKATDYNLL